MPAQHLRTSYAAHKTKRRESPSNNDGRRFDAVKHRPIGSGVKRRSSLLAHSAIDKKQYCTTN